MSAARSVTASCDRLLLPPPQPAAELGQRRPALRAADVLLHQLDLRAGHVELRAAVELQHQVLFDLLVLLQQLQAAVAGDAVRQTWTTRSPSRSSRKLSITRPSRRGGRPAQVGAVEQLAAADQHDPLGHQAKPGLAACRCGKCSRPCSGGSCVSPNTSASRCTSASVWQTTIHLLPGPGRVQLVADLVDVAAESLDRLDLQPAGRLRASRRPPPTPRPTGNRNTCRSASETW